MAVQLTAEHVIGVLQEADSYLSLVGFRHADLLPAGLSIDLKAASQRCRNLIHEIEEDHHNQQDPRPLAYLFGPVSGRIEAAKLEFAQAQRQLERQGYRVLNPIERANNPEAEADAREHGRAAAGRPPWQQVMCQCFRDVISADELWGLPGWEDSTGGSIELFLAQVIGTPVHAYPTGELLTPRLELVHWRDARGRLVWPRA